MTVQGPTTRFKLARELEVGDIIVFGGTPHLISNIEPYDHPTVDAWMIKASSDDGFYINLSDVHVEVAG